MGFLFISRTMLKITQTKRTKVDTFLEVHKGKLNDYTLSEVFILIYGQEAYYCTSWGQFLIFQDNYYKRYIDRDIERLLNDLILQFFPDKVNKMTDSFLKSVRRLLSVRFPRMIEDTELDHHLIMFDDGCYDTNKMIRINSSPALLCFKRVEGVEIDKFEDFSDSFDKYLKTTFVDIDGKYDQKLCDTYQEMLGSLFSSNKGANKAFFLWGDGSNGKSITTELILSLFEKQYHSSASLDALSRQFGLARLIGKIVNVCTEEESQFLKHDVLKALVTGEQIDSEVKFGEAVAFHNFSKLLFATNSFPKFSGLDDALKRRIIIIPYNAKFEGDSIDFGLLEKLKKDRSAIVGFAMRGLKRLQENKFLYTMGESSKLAMSVFHEDSSPVARYANDELVLVDRSNDWAKALVEPIPAMDLYKDYKRWCSENGHSPVASNRFCREIATVDKMKSVRERVRGINKYYVERPDDE